MASGFLRWEDAEAALSLTASDAELLAALCPGRETSPGFRCLARKIRSVAPIDQETSVDWPKQHVLLTVNQLWIKTSCGCKNWISSYADATRRLSTPKAWRAVQNPFGRFTTVSYPASDAPACQMFLPTYRMCSGCCRCLHCCPRYSAAAFCFAVFLLLP